MPPLRFSSFYSPPCSTFPPQILFTTSHSPFPPSSIPLFAFSTYPFPLVCNQLTIRNSLVCPTPHPRATHFHPLLPLFPSSSLFHSSSFPAASLTESQRHHRQSFPTPSSLAPITVPCTSPSPSESFSWRLLLATLLLKPLGPLFPYSYIQFLLLPHSSFPHRCLPNDFPVCERRTGQQQAH